jgi:hypothetical protein
MGFLKKLTRPISKVLDKIVPNEIKPALPFLAAAAPFIAPGIMGIGGNTMLSRALISGGLNLGSQLAQEGSEGDFSPLSVALASGIGALSAPGAGDTLRGVNRLDEFGTAGDVYKGTQAAQAPSGFLGQGKEFLAKGADKLEGIIAAGRAEPFSMAGLKAASIPITQGAMDLGIAESRRAAKDFADEALASLPEGASDADRALAIRQFMEGAGYFSDEEIEETITAAGYADGGRVGLMMGGDPDFSGIKGAVESVDENMRADRAGDFFRLRDEAIQKGDDDKIKEIESDFFKEFGMVMPKMAKDGGLMDLGGKEMDLRKGGFVPIGKKERADDVPARLSKNEFVMTADAVRGAGGGNINKGAKRMYETMNRLEARA